MCVWTPLLQNHNIKAQLFAQTYQKVLGDDYLQSTHQTCYGVMLRQELHSLYDRRLLAFYVQVSIGWLV